MRIAVCFSGQVRTGHKTSQSFLRYLGNLLPHTDFFIHTWRNESISFQDMTVPEELHGHDFPLEFEKLGKVVEIFKPVFLEVSDFNLLLQRENNQKGHVEPFNPMFYSIWRCNKFKKAYEHEWSFTYDYVIRTRFDLLFEEGLSLEADLERHEGGISLIDPSNVIGYALEDQFWISSSPIMDELANFYSIRSKTLLGAKSWQIHMKEFIDSSLGIPYTIIPGNITILR